MKWWVNGATAIVAFAASVAVPVVPGATASPATAPGWAASDISGGLPLAGVSCASPTFCVAVDEAGNAYQWNGSVWSSATAVRPSAPVLRPALDTVSCATPEMCMTGGAEGALYEWNGSVWTGLTSPASAAAITSISCPTTSYCAAVDSYGNAYQWNGSSWTAPTLIGAKSNSGAPYGDPITGVSCASPSSCMAVDRVGSAYHWNGTAWSTRTTVSKGVLNSVSCVSASSCVAVDSSGDAYTWNGASWSTPVAVSPLVELSGVSCVAGPSVTGCEAVDAEGHAYAGTVQPDGSAHWSPAQTLTAHDLPLSGVSCLAETGCLAVDMAGATDSTPAPPSVGLPPSGGSSVGDPAGISFAAPVSYPLDGPVTAIAEGDFGNGRTDLAATVNSGSSKGSQLAVLPGRGDGTYGPPVYYPLPGLSAGSVAVGDFSGTGRDDIAVAGWADNPSQAEVVVFHSQPGGSLSTSNSDTYPLSLPNTVVVSSPALSVVHLTSGGPMSLIVNASQPLSALLVGNGKGGFTPGLIQCEQFNILPVAPDFPGQYRPVLAPLAGTNTLQCAMPDQVRGMSVDTVEASSQSPDDYRPTTGYLSSPVSSEIADGPVSANVVALSPSSSQLVTANGPAAAAVSVTRWWVGPQGAIAPVQELFGAGQMAADSTPGAFGSRSLPGVAVLGAEGSIDVFPSDGHELLPAVSVAAGDTSLSAWGIAAVPHSGGPSDLAVAVATSLSTGEVEIYRAVSPAPAVPVVVPPVVTSVSPASGRAGSSVVVSGSGFSSATSVSFGGVTASFTVLSDSSIEALVPAGLAAGAVDVVVAASGVSSSLSSADRFTVVPPASPAPPGPPAPPVVEGRPGYRLIAADGGVFSFGGAGYYGSLPGLGVHVSDIVGSTAPPGGGGYWMVGRDGGVFGFGDARYSGSLPDLAVKVSDIVAMAATPDGGGYWLVASDGGVFAFGDARFYGSIPGLPVADRPASPVVGLAVVPGGGGYWEVTAAGDVYSFGSARFHGSTGAVALSKPIVAMAATPDGGGYRLVASDGGVFNFGDAGFYGSIPGLPAADQPAVPVTGLADAPGGGGYWEADGSGDVYSFGSAPFDGSLGAVTLSQPVVTIQATG